METRITISLPEDIAEQLRRLSYISRKSKASLIREALELLFKTIPEENK